MQIPWDAIQWWELRRIPYNGILLIIGLLSIALFYLAMPDTAILSLPGLAGVVLYGLAANVCYTLGWLTEWMWSGGDTSLTRGVRSRIFNAGLMFSALLTAAPAFLAIILLLAKMFRRL